MAQARQRDDHDSTVQPEAGSQQRPVQSLKKICARWVMARSCLFLGHNRRRERMLHFNFWLSTRELPPGLNRPKVTLHLLANGKEIAASRAPVVPDTLDWYFYERKELIVEATPKQRGWRCPT